jgi:hypothetical protein
MASYEITDFKNGMDLRKMYATAPAGSLRLLRNAVINSGAEVEKRAGFPLWGAVPSTSIGLLSKNGIPYVIVNGASGIVDGDMTTKTVGVISLPFPTGGVTIDYVADWDLFNDHFYIVLQGTNNVSYHYYNQLKVTDAMATSDFVRTYGSKMYGLDGRILRFSAINDPTKWTPPASGTTADGSGYIDLSAQDADSTTLVGMEVYYGQMAIFSALSTQFWTLDPDPQQNKFNQLLRNTGLVARHCVTQYGSGDVMYLSPFGLRSLRLQSLSQVAGSTDIGTPIDKVLRPLIWSMGVPWFRTARLLIEPRVGRLWLVLPDRIYVLSTYQEPTITAWSVFDVPFTISDSVIADPYVMLRGADNNIYWYGGATHDQYDTSQAEVILPCLPLDTPNMMKMFQGFDVACAGTWQFSAGLDPNNDTVEELVATLTNSTFLNGEMRMPGWGTHISLRLRTTDASAATLGRILIHYMEGEKG